MALTTEEKIAKLQTFEHWLGFTEPQRKFLLAMAEGLKPHEAFIKAYPDTKAPSLVFATQQMMCRVGIKKALAFIEIEFRKPTVSRTEALELLSTHLRKIDDPDKLVKLLGVYAKIAGWGKEEKNLDEEVPMDKLVAAVEKKRRGQTQ